MKKAATKQTNMVPVLLSLAATAAEMSLALKSLAKAHLAIATRKGAAR